MKYLVIADIHGSSESSKIILEKFKKYNCDKIILLGDILYHGPRNDLPSSYCPKDVIKDLNPYSNRIIAVKGNCEAEVDSMVLNFKIHNKYTLKCGKRTYLLVHGHHLEKLNSENLKGIDVVLYGHTHINKLETINNVIYLNIASITLPKENNPRTYALLDDSGVEVFDLNDKLINKI